MIKDIQHKFTVLDSVEAYTIINWNRGDINSVFSTSATEIISHSGLVVKINVGKTKCQYAEVVFTKLKVSFYEFKKIDKDILKR
ncbi:hypothetical protein ACVWYG_001888 [Pedobacter sp. UYEF25]